MVIINSQRCDRWISFGNSKCRVAVPRHDDLLRDAVEQAALDASVRSISQRVITDQLLRRLAPNGIVLNRVDGRFLLVAFEQLQKRTGAEEARLEDTLRSNGLSLIERDAVDIQTEPIFSNARAVWSREHYPVPLSDRLKFAAALADSGPQSIAELKARANPACDTLAAACALACADLVELKLHVPIGPNTIVSARNHDR